MNIKKELEILRGEPISEYRGNPLDIPCKETVDADRICPSPVVSVYIITYQHEKYIARAIEGVISQETDFQYELIIGEDCSSDRTREICFEYQRRYPDRIRVLWADVNVNQCGGNSRRCLARCRGEFIAECEGDDYWTNPKKLQQQVDAMRAHPNVTLCAGAIDTLNEETGCLVEGHALQDLWKEGVTPRDEAFYDARWLPTCTHMFRRSAYEQATKKFDIFRWGLCLGDVLRWQGLTYFGDVYITYEKYGVYRSQPNGLMHTRTYQVYRDSAIISIYFALVTGEKSIYVLYNKILQLLTSRCHALALKDFRTRYHGMCELLSVGWIRDMFVSMFGVSAICLMLIGKPYWFFRRVMMGMKKRIVPLALKIYGRGLMVCGGKVRK